jgi:protocatechuate 3,4-dioxygenase beta subunit
VRLDLTFVVVRSDGECAPVAGAQVDVWHANASGLYSDEAANGWYSGRTIHIQFKVRKDGYEFTSQLFFDESVVASVLADSAYSSRGGPTASR